MGKAAELEADDIRPVHAAFVAWGFCLRQFPELDMDSADGVTPRLKEVVDAWACASMVAALGYLARCLAGDSPELDRRDHIKKLAKVFQGLADQTGASASLLVYLPGLKQAIALLD